MVASNGIPSGGSGGFAVPLVVAKGGTGQTTLTAHALLVGNGTTGIQALAPSTARNVAISDGTDWVSRALQAADIPALSYVTSVALALPAIFTVSGSPVTGAGTLTGTLATQTANQVWAGPTTGAAAAPTFRALVAADIPPLTLAKISDAGTMAAQNANAVAITGGTINGTTLGATAPAAITGTAITANTKFVGSAIEPASDSTTAVVVRKAAAGANILVVDTTNSRVGIGITPTQPGLQVEVGSGVGGVFVTGSETPLVEVGPTLHSGVQLYWAGNRGNVGTDSNAAPLWLLGSNIVLAPTTGTGAIQFAPLGGTDPVMNIDTTNKVVTITSTNAATVTVTDVAILDHSGGTSADGFGTGLLIRGKDATTASINMAAIRSRYTTAAHLNAKTQTDYINYDAAQVARVAMSTGANGTVPLWGVFGSCAIQFATTGTTTGFTAGSGTAMNSASTSTGGTGSTAYTFGDLVLALKTNGQIAA